MAGENLNGIEQKLKGIEQHYIELEIQMADPEVATDHRQITQLGRERLPL